MDSLVGGGVEGGKTTLPVISTLAEALKKIEVFSRSAVRSLRRYTHIEYEYFPFLHVFLQNVAAGEKGDFGSASRRVLDPGFFGPRG